MSRSPDQLGAAEEEVAGYRQGWSALSELIGQGRSFSGFERNCAFLNVRGERFANVSSSTGLDLVDDTRAVATSDWDGDGQLDFWISNRTAPRLRFLRNVSSGPEGGGNHVAIRLQGVRSHRDAIGARVEVYRVGDDQPLLRTLHAGDGFLAQSSKWLHFGLGRAGGIDRVIVRWPGSREGEVFAGVPMNARCVLTEGGGTVIEEEALPFPVGGLGLGAGDPGSGATRTWIMGRVPMPPSEHITVAGGQPTLLNLWSGTCRSCALELAEWSREEAAIRRAGLEIVALSVDHLSGEDVPGNAGLLDRVEFPFVRGEATQALVNAMEIVHRTFVERQEALPVPSSFLIDKVGRVAAIYKGRVGVETLLEDVALLDADLVRQRESAVPYAGRWASTPFVPNPVRLAAAFEKAGLEGEAIAYLKHFLAGARRYLEDQFGSQEQRLQIVIDAHQWLGDLLAGETRYAEAARVYRNLQTLAPDDAIRHQGIGERLLTQNLAESALSHLLIAAQALPENADLYFNTGLASLGAGKISQAIDYFGRSLALSPDDKATHFQMAAAQELAAKPAEAARHYRAALRAHPGWPVAAIKLTALIVKQSQTPQPVGTLEEALGLAEALCRQTNRQDPRALYALAQVELAAKRPQRAAAIIEEALPLAQGPRDASLREALMRLRGR